MLIFGFSLPASKKRFDDEVVVFTQASLHDIGITQNGLLLFSLLSEGDYSLGVRGCGPACAFALAQCEFGNELIHAIDTLSAENLTVFLDGWRDSLRRELTTNSQGRLRQRQPHIASQISDTFPDLKTLALYRHPLITTETTIDVNSTWIGKEPSLRHLAEFGSLHFGWEGERKLIEEFESRIWEGAVLQLIYSVSDT